MSYLCFRLLVVTLQVLTCCVLPVLHSFGSDVRSTHSWFSCLCFRSLVVMLEVLTCGFLSVFQIVVSDVTSTRMLCPVCVADLW